MSILPYFFNSNYMPFNSRKKNSNRDSSQHLGEDNAYLDPLSSASIQTVKEDTFNMVRPKLKLMPNHTRDCIFTNNENLGMGIKNPEAIFR
mmetsp:Transcript_22102/g.26538  ORF Transcript_22102/g.26538 Transcript_22102/m.26538 type:complete len:91 (-) Transcript_22102:147-419(-)